MKFRIPGLILLLSLSLLFSLSSCEQPVLFNFGFASPVSPGDTVTSDTSESSESSDSPDTSESPDTVPDSEPESLPDTDTAPAAETEKTDFGVYFREKIAPVLLAVSTGAGTLYVAILPVLTRIKQSYESFRDATAGVNATAAKGDQNSDELKRIRSEMEHEMELLRRQNEALISQINGKFAQYEEKVLSCDSASREILEIVRIGFCNTDELVRKGFAAKIAKVGDTLDSEKNEDPSSDPSVL